MYPHYFSVILPSYNRAHFLPIAIRSVITQTFENWELIVIDDGSTDNTKKIIQSYNDVRIKYVYQSNQERCAARNNGVEISIGKYICLLDSDDYFLANRLELLYKKILELNEPSAFMFTDVCFDYNGIIRERQENDPIDFQNKYDFFIHSHIHCQQTCTKREILVNNKFNTDFNIGEDTELWLRIITNNNYIYIKHQHTVVVKEHDDRCINISLHNAYYYALKTFQYERKFFSYPFSKNTLKYMYRDCHFGMGKYYVYQKLKYKAVYHFILSILYDIKQKQLKYRLNIIFNLIFNIKKALLLIEINETN